MPDELPPPFAEPAEVLGGVTSIDAVFEAITATQVQTVARLALLVPLCFLRAEFFVRLRTEHLLPRGVHDITEPERLFNEEIAGIDVTIIFYDKILAAIPPQTADINRTFDHLEQNGVEMTDRNPVDIFGMPFIEDFAHKPTPLCTIYGKRQQLTVFIKFHTRDILMIEKALIHQIAVGLPSTVDI
jgi:hypothetical protein